MANIFELNINLNEVGSSEAESALKETTSGSVADVEESGENRVLAGLKSAVKMAGKVHLIQKVNTDVIRPLTNLQMTTVGTIYGDTARMGQIQNLTSSVSAGIDLVNTGLSGYSVGKALGGGKAGTAVAVISIVMDVLGSTIDMINNGREFDNKQLDHKYNAAYGQERLGLLAINKGR